MAVEEDYVRPVVVPGYPGLRHPRAVVAVGAGNPAGIALAERNRFGVDVNTDLRGELEAIRLFAGQVGILAVTALDRRRVQPVNLVAVERALEEGNPVIAGFPRHADQFGGDDSDVDIRLDPHPGTAAGVGLNDPGVGIHINRGVRPDLFEVALASAVAGGVAGPVQGREQHAGQNRDDGNHHQKLNQRKVSMSHCAILSCYV